MNPTDPEEWHRYGVSAIVGMETQGWVKVKQYSLAYTPPTKAEITPVVVESFKTKIRETRAQAESECKRLQETLDRFLALEYTPQAFVAPDIGDEGGEGGVL